MRSIASTSAVLTAVSGRPLENLRYLFPSLLVQSHRAPSDVNVISSGEGAGLERLRHSSDEVAKNGGGHDLSGLVRDYEPIAVGKDDAFDPTVDVFDRAPALA